jgi:hypothetical protein
MAALGSHEQKQTSNFQKQTSNFRPTFSSIREHEEQKQTSNFRGAERGRTDSAARILRDQPESAHSGV